MTAPASKLDRLVAKYRRDHTHPVNHFLHVGVGWPMVAAGRRPAAVPAALVARPLPRRLRPDVLRPLPLRAEPADHPEAPEHPVRDRLGRDPRPLRGPAPPGDPAAAGGRLDERLTRFEIHLAENVRHRWPPSLARSARPTTARRMTLRGVHRGRLRGRLALRAGPGSDRRDGSPRPPPWADRSTGSPDMFILLRSAHPGVINYRAGGGECRLRLPGMQSDRHPDQAIYLFLRRRKRQALDALGPRTSSSRSSARGARIATTSRSARNTSASASSNTGSSTRCSSGSSSSTAPATSGTSRSSRPARRIGRTSCLV